MLTGLVYVLFKKILTGNELTAEICNGYIINAHKAAGRFSNAALTSGFLSGPALPVFTVKRQ